MGGKRLIAACAVLALSVAVAAGPAAAKQFSGSKKGETIVGTKGADKIKGKGGKDKLKGKGGNDSLSGGKGKDKVTGGKGADRHLGGAGDDTLNAADGRLDRAINGGPGTNTCIIDTALELSIVQGCTNVQAGGPGSGTGPGGGGGGGSPGGGTGLRVLTANGLTCLPLVGCLFLISGDGADSLLGSVAGGGSVTSVLNVAVNVITGTWIATGTYTCSAAGGPGFLEVTIGTKTSGQVPVSCG